MTKPIKILSREQEVSLAERWIKHSDEAARDLLVTSHIPLAHKLAKRFRYWGIAIEDLESEAVAGLVIAVDRFDPKNGARLSTYASWWIKSQVQDYVARNWSMVRIPGMVQNKSLLFSLKVRVKNSGLPIAQALRKVAAESGVPLGVVNMLQTRLTVNDISLHMPVAGTDTTVEAALPSDDDGPDVIAEENIDRGKKRIAIDAAIKSLNSRERMIVRGRFLKEEPDTLMELGERLGISKERVRQIESAAKLKLSKNPVLRDVVAV